MQPILATLVYAVHEGRVLLLKRRRPPFVGHWVAPGGKIDAGESPYEGAGRELAEETGLSATSLILRGIVREVSPRPDWQWLIFLFLARDPVGEVTSDEREGEVRWWPADRLGDLLLPDSDRIFLPHILGPAPGVYQATYHYDDGLALMRVVEHAVP